MKKLIFSLICVVVIALSFITPTLAGEEYYATLVGTTEPSGKGLKVGALFYNLNTNTWEKCTNLSPITWTPITGSGATWGGITGTMSSQADLQGALDGKESFGAVTTHEETYVHSEIAHANRTVLDATQESFITSLKTSYDWLVNNITEAWKTTVVDHIASTSNPHSVTANQVLPSQTGQGGKFLKTDGSNPSWDTVGGGVAWGGITGTLSNQTDLQSALDGKEPANANIQTHVTSAHAPSNAQKNSDITKAEIEAKLTGEISSHTHAGGGGESESVVVLTGTVANSTVNLADATGLTFSGNANSTYIVETFLVWNASASTVGIKISATASGSPTVQAGHFITDAINGTPDSSSWNANDVVVTTSASAFTTNNVGKVNAVLKTAGSTSTWQLRFAAETTGTITLQAGSTLRYRKVA